MNYAWINGTRFYWVNRTKIYSIEGSKNGTLDLSKAKSFWMSGPTLRYYDAYGQPRTINMSSMSPQDIDPTKQRRAIWVPEGRLLEMRDATGERRRLVHLDYSDDNHGDYGDYSEVAAGSGTTHLDHPHTDQWFFYDQPAEYHEYNEEVAYSDKDYSQHFDYSDIDHGDFWRPHADVEYTDWDLYSESPHQDAPWNEYPDYTDEHTDHTDETPWQDLWSWEEF